MACDWRTSSADIVLHSDWIRLDDGEFGWYRPIRFDIDSFALRQGKCQQYRQI